MSEDATIIREQVAQLREDLAEWGKETVAEKATDENKKLTTDTHYLKYAVKELKKKEEEMAISGGQKVFHPLKPVQHFHRNQKSN
jgi:hypothetical protein